MGGVVGTDQEVDARSPELLGRPEQHARPPPPSARPRCGSCSRRADTCGWRSRDAHAGRGGPPPPRRSSDSRATRPRRSPPRCRFAWSRSKPKVPSGRGQARPVQPVSHLLYRGAKASHASARQRREAVLPRVSAALLPTPRCRTTLSCSHVPLHHSIYKPALSRSPTSLRSSTSITAPTAAAIPTPRDLDAGPWADDVQAFCEALDIEHPIVLGLSFGGTVALATHPPPAAPGKAHPVEHRTAKHSPAPVRCSAFAAQSALARHRFL